MSDAPLLRHAATRFHGRYVVRPSQSRRSDLWFVGFHGQGQTAEVFLEPLERVPRGADWLVASVQGLNRHYSGRTREIVATWMTSQDRELAIADNITWVDTVLDRLEQEFGPPRAIVFAGFSQGVAMAYRAGLLCRRTGSAIVACCGDVPPELMSADTRPWPRVLAATGASDTWYTPARLAADAEFLRTRRPDADVQVFEGGHEWSDALSEAAGRLLEAVEASVQEASGTGGAS
jgi:predicted esterase